MNRLNGRETVYMYKHSTEIRETVYRYKRSTEIRDIVYMTVQAKYRNWVTLTAFPFTLVSE